MRKSKPKKRIILPDPKFNDVLVSKFVNNEIGLSLFGIDNKQILIKREFCLSALQTVHRFMVDILAT